MNPVDIEGVVETILVRNHGSEDLQTCRVDDVAVSFAGFAGDTHAGLTRLSDVRVRKTYTNKTIIRNTRQVSILSSEELHGIADHMGITEVRPEWVGANLVMSGIPELTLLPPSTRMIFSSGASLVVDMENAPCRYPGDMIDRHHPGYGRHFVAAAANKRGLTAWVEKEGHIRANDKVSLHLPPQRFWRPGSAQ